ncbi:E3 ubiquitin ligase family protein [Kibdelosporangium phytohabitans]|uniref:RING-type E3 ubiquitin transferase n=1 Tax=Kibdelosporangium phytohabitans TaxID=860235 RepID=A0A0N9HZT3_9PSEU|nr:E3 ubiquitin ligase family protein [Kibdelosporangium phytohabitans]ALG10833.1 helicase [Kibdelosporangium phytohabitans]MBE1462008.1 hypothetical protein [Kibdelosporangium phytohabitans]
MTIPGVVFVLASFAGFWWMRHTKSELHAMIGTETLPIPELEDLRRVSDELGARGGFRKTAEVVGAAHPRPEGPLISELSKTECVWYSYRVDRHYEHVEYRDGKRRTSKRTEKVAEHTTGDGYAVIDPDGNTIGVDPGGTKPDGTEQTVNRFEPHRGDGGGITIFGINVGGGGGGSTIGFEYREWLIRTGRPLYILGEVHDKIGPLVIAKPEKGGHFIISTRTEAELRESRTKRHQWLAIGVIAAFALGAALTIWGIVR